MKYIMFKTDVNGVTRFEPVIFSNMLVHADVAKALSDSGVLEGFEIHSAGEFTPMSCSCHGLSSTLKVMSDDADDNRIRYADCGGLHD